jgi:hypothetical protein
MGMTIDNNNSGIMSTSYVQQRQQQIQTLEKSGPSIKNSDITNTISEISSQNTTLDKTQLTNDKADSVRIAHRQVQNNIPGSLVAATVTDGAAMAEMQRALNTNDLNLAKQIVNEMVIKLQEIQHTDPTPHTKIAAVSGTIISINV